MRNKRFKDHIAGIKRLMHDVLSNLAYAAA